MIIRLQNRYDKEIVELDADLCNDWLEDKEGMYRGILLYWRTGKHDRAEAYLDDDWVKIKE